MQSCKWNKITDRPFITNLMLCEKRGGLIVSLGLLVVETQKNHREPLQSYNIVSVLDGGGFNNKMCMLPCRLNLSSLSLDSLQDMLGKCRTRCRIGLENYALTMQIRSKETEIAEKSLQLVDLERELAEKREQLARTKERAKQLQNEAKKKCGDPSGLSQEKQRVSRIAYNYCCIRLRSQPTS